MCSFYALRGLYHKLFMRERKSHIKKWSFLYSAISAINVYFVVFVYVCLCLYASILCVCVYTSDRNTLYTLRSKKLGRNLTFHIFSDKTTINQVKRGSSEETSKKFAFSPFRWHFSSKTGSPSVVKWLNCKQLKLTFALNNFDQVMRKFESRCLHFNCLSTRFSDDFFSSSSRKKLKFTIIAHSMTKSEFHLFDHKRLD